MLSSKSSGLQVCQQDDAEEPVSQGWAEVAWQLGLATKTSSGVQRMQPQ